MAPPEPQRYPMWASGSPRPASLARRREGARARRLWLASLYEPRMQLATGDDPWRGGPA